MRDFENRVSRRTFGAKTDELRWKWRKLNEEELNDLCCLMICITHPIFSGDQIEKKEMGGACSTYGGEGRCLEGFGGET